jgi:replicative DNA helicase
VPTGFQEIDEEYGGIRRGVATALVAHSGVGKSTFGRQVAEAAARAGGGVLWVCGEDPEEPTAERVLADRTGITSSEMGRLDLTPGELDRIEQAAVDAQGWAQNIQVVFDAPSVEDCLTLVDDTQFINGKPLVLTVFDYVQIFGDADNLEAQVATLSRGMAVRAVARHLANLLLSQASNAVIQRGREEYNRTKSVRGFLPGKGDIEWCKRMEKSVKAYWVLDRPGLWKREMGEEDPDDTAELHVKKANFGPTGWVPIGWDGQACRFKSLR